MFAMRMNRFQFLFKVDVFTSVENELKNEISSIYVIVIASSGWVLCKKGNFSLK
jgi:hypothetical protein